MRSNVPDWKLAVPTANRSQTLKQFHDDPQAAHFGPEFLNFCGSQKSENTSRPGLMDREKKVSHSFQLISMNLLGPLPKSKNGNQHLFVVTDWLSKFFLVQPLRSATTKPIIKFLKKQVFSIFGVPQIVVFDNGSQFVSKEFCSFLDSVKVPNVWLNVRYHPQTNLTERVNRVLVKDRLHKAYEQNVRQYNLRKRPLSFSIGDTVWKKNFVQSDAAKSFSKKLAPCRVAKMVSHLVYQLKDLDALPMRSNVPDWKLVVPTANRSQTLKQFHDDPQAAHFGPEFLNCIIGPNLGNRLGNMSDCEKFVVVRRIVVFDNGSQFVSKEFRSFMDSVKVSKVWLNDRYHPQTNPTESVNRVLVTVISSYIKDSHREWDKHIFEIAQAIRSACHDSTQVSPNQLFWSQEMAQLPELYQEVKDGLHKAYEQNVRQYNLCKRPLSFSVSDTVWKKNFVQSDAAKSFSKKLAPCGVAKMVSHLVYQLKDLDEAAMRWDFGSVTEVAATRSGRRLMSVCHFGELCDGMLGVLVVSQSSRRVNISDSKFRKAPAISLLDKASMVMSSSFFSVPECLVFAALRSIRACPGAKVNSYHNPLIAKLRIKLKKITAKVRDQRLNIRNLKEVAIENTVKRDIRENIMKAIKLNRQEGDVNKK
ncbi:hypothetical protein ILUMI_26998 [Ignelater luminosus]|uniref:Integrase catalytic domain-containing protein n=1 Tax=Ignelater luminosus TaxID=2038154 RepID=A0A8K0C7E7_IGNLU|nr:hypothetical protein ILUMI_26998 [Ignelater luminosus]